MQEYYDESLRYFEDNTCSCRVPQVHVGINDSLTHCKINLGPANMLHVVSQVKR